MKNFSNPKLLYLILWPLGLWLMAVGCAPPEPGPHLPAGQPSRAQAELSAADKPPTNIIVFISDGCGYYHVDAASLYECGRTNIQTYESFPVRLAMTTFAARQTYNPNRAWKSFDYVKTGYTDSAAAATAMSTGVKTYSGAIGLDPNRQPLKHVIEQCEKLGMATGVITSVPISHATPAGFVAHNTSRNNYADIAKEMFYKSPCECLMGCGHPEFDDDGSPIPPKNTEFVGGPETWADLKDSCLTGADADGDGLDDDWTVIFDRADFQKLAAGDTPKRVIAIPKALDTLQQTRAGDPFADPYVVPFNPAVPTLAEMTKAALNILDNDPDGFFVMIEGGAVDWASHANQSGRLIEEQIDFNKAVEAVIDWVEANSSWTQTLVLVTADHECGYLTGPDSGPATRRPPQDVPSGAADGEKGPVWKPLVNNAAKNLPGMKWNSKGHTNSLVPFYAKGSGAEYFNHRAHASDPVHGPYIDNTDIAKVIFHLFSQRPTEPCPTTEAEPLSTTSSRTAP